MANKTDWQHTRSSIDSSIFSNQSQANDGCNDYKSCISIQRLLIALKYYTLLKPQQNIEKEEIFIEFMQDVYKEQVIDDLYHFTHIHGGELKKIMEYKS